MNDTYDSLDWIHPDLKSYRYELDTDKAWPGSVIVFYKDIDSPRILHLVGSTYHIALFCYASPSDFGQGFYVFYSTISSNISSYVELVCYNESKFIVDIGQVKFEESVKHKLYCLEWDLKTGKKDPVEYLFNSNPTLREIAKKYV